MIAFPTLESRRLILRELRPEDAPSFYELKEDPWIADNGLSVGYPYPRGAAERFIERSRSGPEKNQYIWAITLKSEFIGIVSLSVTPSHQHGQLGYWIGKDFRNQGYTTEAARCVMHHGFKTFQLHRVFAQTFTHNPASIRVLEKLGMKYEATLRQHIKHDSGEFRDIYIFGILRSDL